MKTKVKNRFVIVPVEGPILAGVPGKWVLDNSTSPPTKLKTGQKIKIAGRMDRVGNVYNEYPAEQECKRLNMLNEVHRASGARSIKKAIGRKMKLYTFGIGWNRRSGGKNAVLCLLPGGNGVMNVNLSTGSHCAAF